MVNEALPVVLGAGAGVAEKPLALRSASTGTGSRTGDKNVMIEGTW